MSNKTPADKINLRLILIDGKKRDFLFAPNHSANYVTDLVYNTWEEAKNLEGVNNNPKFLKLIYQGRFLHGNVILGALLLPLGKTSVMHLVARENLPEPNPHDDKKKTKRFSSVLFHSCCFRCFRIT
ncbi:unnamed protein product [Gordionus sp. m RMFG-2023]|uniref:ubiquitin-like protein 3 n=1 Tax=Gordionus sp. m RMFG-2023 TaxID=3053472 RepID=UPI0030E44E39